MKKNVFVRIMAALGGLALWMVGLCMLAETFFRVPVTVWLGELMAAHSPLKVLLMLVLALLLCAFGTSCWMMLSSKRVVKRTGFVMQKGENGVIGVSVRSIEGLVQTCINQHDVVASAEISVVEKRDGIVILLNIEEAAGVNIPLAVGALQKQIKQYVNACTGVDVHEVRVMVENTDSGAVASPYAVQEPVVLTTAVTAAELQREVAVAESAEAPVLVVEEQVEEIAEEAIPVMELPVEMPAEEPAGEEIAVEAPVEEPIPVAQPIPMVIPAMPEIPEEEDDRPLHQRLFGAEEEPVFVPAPPELVVEAAAVEEIVEEPAEEMPEEVVEEAPAEEIDANAVLDVVAAMAEEAAAEEAEDAFEQDVPAETDEEIQEDK